MLPLHTPSDLVKLRRAGKAAAATLTRVQRALRPGMTAGDIDRLVRRDTKERGGRPSQLGFHGFPGAVCVSPNDVVCHGVPTDRVVLGSGDIVNVDVTTELDGWHGDTSRTFVLGRPSPEAAHVVDVAQRAFQAGIAAVRPGGRLGDVGAAIAELVRREGCTVVQEYGGHGIGRQMHLPPHVSHDAVAGEGVRLVPGLTFTIEPMVNLGGPEVVLDEVDGWTVRTADGQLSAQFEHTIVVTEDGAAVLTR